LRANNFALQQVGAILAGQCKKYHEPDALEIKKALLVAKLLTGCLPGVL
jgi:hypothetical protein